MFKKLEKPQFVLETEQCTKKKNIFLELLIYFGIFIASQLISGVVVMPVMVLQFLMNPEAMAQFASGSISLNVENLNSMMSGSWMTALNLYITVFIIILSILYCRLFERRKPAQLGFRKKGIISQYLIGLVIGFAMISLSILFSVLIGDFKFNGLNTTIRPGMLILYFIGFLIQGMSEEVMCRGYLLPTLSNGRSIWIGVIINSIIFMALHTLNPGVKPLAFVNLFLFGFFASLYIIKTGNIWGIAAIHSIWNFAQGNFYGVQVSGLVMEDTIFTTSPVGARTIFNGGSFGAEGGLGVTLVLVVGCVILLLMKNRQVEPQAILPPKKKKQPAAPAAAQ